MKEGYIGLIGLGAIGAPLAEMLYKKYGSRFVLISDDQHAARLTSGRIRINGDRFAPQVITPSNYRGEHIDVLFVCVKLYSLESTFESIKGMISDDTLLMPLQNGLYAYDYLRSHFPENIVLEGFAQGLTEMILYIRIRVLTTLARIMRLSRSMRWIYMSFFRARVFHVFLRMTSATLYGAS